MELNDLHIRPKQIAGSRIKSGREFQTVIGLATEKVRQPLSVESETRYYQ